MYIAFSDYFFAVLMLSFILCAILVSDKYVLVGENPSEKDALYAYITVEVRAVFDRLCHMC